MSFNLTKETKKSDSMTNIYIKDSKFLINSRHRCSHKITTKYVSSLRVYLRNIKLKNSAKDSILKVKNKQVEHEMHLISL